MKKILCSVFLISFAAALFAQQDAYVLYREGRNKEKPDSIADAIPYYTDAVNICKAELAANPRNMESYVVLCWSLFRLKFYNESLTYSLEALKINPQEYRIIENLGEVYFYLDNYSESMRNFEKYVSALPNGDRVDTAYFYLGEIYRLTGKPNHADIAYSHAVRKAPNMSLWWYRLGLAREKAGNKEGAKTAFQQALKLKNNDYPDAQQALNRVS